MDHTAANEIHNTTWQGRLPGRSSLRETGRAMYDHDPDQLPDSEFVTGTVRRLCPGNSGRLLDARRTPIVIVDVIPRVGMFELEVTAFEDAGARWVLPIEDVAKFQFCLDARTASPDEVAIFEAAVQKFNKELRIDIDTDAEAETEKLIEHESETAADWFTEHSRFFGSGAELDLSSPEGPTSLRADLVSYLDSRAVGDIEEAFATTWVSNPASGEVIKGHRIAIAQLGLAPYDGLITRCPSTFTGIWSLDRRIEHIVTRLGFLRALFTTTRIEHVILYRGLSFEHPPPSRRTSTLISATFQRAVAESWMDADPKVFSVSLMRQPVPVSRLLMTYLETDAMNSQFAEAEAVLIAHPLGPLF